MGQTVDDRSLDVLFRSARTHAKWQPRPVTDDTLRNLYELLKWAPTSANAAPARFAFLRSKEAKERLRPALAPLNVEKTMTAPVTVIVAYDVKFYEQLQAKVDEEFFAAGKPCFGCDQEFFPEGHVRTNFLCNLGYGDPAALHPRLPRLPFTDACSLL